VRTLIVDDNSLIRVVLRRVLLQFGECDEARDGHEALRAFQSHPYDLVCVDLEMPDMDGFTLLEQLRAIEEEQAAAKRARILVITAQDELSSIRSAAELGADGYLLKPIHPGVLSSKLTELLSPRNSGPDSR
jgi:two-component system chemotaxis response regulator CheY